MQNTVNLQQAANQAIFHLQLDTVKAVKYVEQQVPGAQRGAVLAALVDTMVWYKTSESK